MSFKGIIPAVCTWFHQDGTLDLDTQFEHADFLIQAGVHGLFIQGSGGEFPYMTVEERKDHAKAVVDHVNGRIPVIVGVNSASTNEAVELARHAEKAGADAIVAVTPYYWTITDDLVLKFYTDLGQACGLPLIAYNFPDLTGQRLGSRLLLRMLESVPTLAGIKDTIDSQAHIRDIIFRVKSVHPDFAVMAGIDEYLLGTLIAGGDGLMGSTPNFLPKLSVDLYQAFLNKDFEGVVEGQRKISGLGEITMNSRPGVASFKEAALVAMGRPSGAYVRPPLGAVSPEGVERIKKAMKKYTD